MNGFDSTINKAMELFDKIKNKEAFTEDIGDSKLIYNPAISEKEIYQIPKKEMYAPYMSLEMPKTFVEYKASSPSVMWSGLQVTVPKHRLRDKPIKLTKLSKIQRKLFKKEVLEFKKKAKKWKNKKFIKSYLKLIRHTYYHDFSHIKPSIFDTVIS